MKKIYSDKDLTLVQGAKAYFDSFDGLIPCQVVSVRHTENATTRNLSNTTVSFRVTARHSPIYRLGEILEANGTHVVPRGAIRRYNNKIRILYYPYEVNV